MYKFINLLFLILFAVSGSTQSNGVKVKKVSFSSGFELDAVYDLGEDYFLNSIKGIFSDQLVNLDGFEKNLNEMFCENANIRLGVSLYTPKLKNTELNLAFYKIDARYDAVEYTFHDQENTFEGLTYASHSDEAGLEIALVRILPIFKFIEIHAGLGSQMGYSYKSNLHITHQKNTFEEVQPEPLSPNFQNNEPFMEITESVTLMEEDYRMKNSWSQKAFVESGIGLIFLNRVEIGLMARYGFGHRFLAGNDYLTKLTSYNFTMAYRLI